MDGRSETSETRSYKDSMAFNVAAIRNARKNSEARSGIRRRAHRQGFGDIEPGRNHG
jgi:hypothetical protein